MFKEFKFFSLYMLNFWRCWGKYHNWQKAGDSLGGDWVRCSFCYKLDEYIPGMHEPEGYRPQPSSHESNQ